VARWQSHVTSPSLVVAQHKDEPISEFYKKRDREGE
jgi:hypothetical protein